LRSVGRRLLRATASLLCLLSLLLCLAACWLWVRSRSPEPVVASLATAGRTYEVRSRDGRLAVLRIEGARPGHGVSYPTNPSSAAAWMLMAAVAPPPPVKSGFAGVEVERGQLQALEGTAPAWPPNGMLTVLTGGESQAIFDGYNGRLTLQNAPITTATLVANQLVYDPVSSGIVQLPPPLMAARVTVPYRLIAGITALLPALWLGLSARGAWTARRVAQRKRGGLCTDCGYDLRGTPGAARCPECGRERPVA
jgi:hypothetical protein